MKKSIFYMLISLTMVLFSTNGYADSAEFRTVVSQNDASVAGEFHLDLQMRITSGDSPRTLNSLTIDVYYGSELTEWGDNPATGWAIGSSNGYTRSANKNSGYYRILATGGSVNEDGNTGAGSGNPPGWDVTTSWQTIVTLRWTINSATSVNISIDDDTDAAAYFDNYTNAPPGDATSWTVSNQDLGDTSLPVELSIFQAIQEGRSVILNWTTESETDNMGFILERNEAQTGWEEIASYLTNESLKSAGNTSASTDYTFTDAAVKPACDYAYRLSDVDTKGIRTYNDVISLTTAELPKETRLLPASPNPFNPRTKIQYALSEDTDVTLLVIDMMGRTVQSILSNKSQQAGHYSIHWNGRNNNGLPASSGVYFLILKTQNLTKSQKVLLMR